MKKYLISLFTCIIVSMQVFPQDYELKLESALGYSTSVVKIEEQCSDYKALAEKSCKIGLLTGIKYSSNLSLNTGLSYVFVQLPQKREYDSTNSPYAYYVSIFNERLHYISVPFYIGYSVDYFTVCAGGYFAFCLNPDSFWDGPKYYDIGANLKLQFDIFKGFYLFQESRIGIANISTVTTYTKRQYSLSFGLGYSFCKKKT